MVMRLLAPARRCPGKDAADALGLAICHAHAAGSFAAIAPERRRSRRAPRGRYKSGANLLSSASKCASADGPGRRRAESSGDNRRPMYALFEDAGKFHAGRVMSETDSLAADRARLGQARQGQGGQRAAALRAARARRR